MKLTGDGETDCQPVVFDRCAAGAVRDASGSCVIPSDDTCSSRCASGTGKYVTRLGICECEGQDDLDQVCDKTCRESSPTVFVNADGDLVEVDPATNTTSRVNINSRPDFYGSITCANTDPDADACSVKSMSTSAAGFAGSYDSSLSTSNRRKLLTRKPNVHQYKRRLREKVAQLTQTHNISFDKSTAIVKIINPTTGRSLAEEVLEEPVGIKNPCMCLAQGDSILFDFADGQANYPIYLKDSLLNTNKDFDYGAFRGLATKAASTSTLTSFGFTFDDRTSRHGPAFVRCIGPFVR